MNAEPETLVEEVAVDLERRADLGGDVAPIVKMNDLPGSVEVHLIFPFKVDGKMLRKVRVRQPSQEDIDDFSSGKLPTFRDLLVRLTGLHNAVIRALTWEDSKAVHQIFRDVLPAFIEERLED